MHARLLPLQMLLPQMRQVAGLPEAAGEQLEVGEESKGGAPSLHALLPGHTARAAQLQNGDILVLSLAVRGGGGCVGGWGCSRSM